MPHPDRHPRSDPEDRFDSWLDGLVAGTPADAASLNDTDGSLGRAMSGARQLHGLAARTTPATAARRRIEDDLMRSGALAAPRGTTWIPNEKETKRTPWWSPASPAIAAALVVALLVALGASFIATQRSTPSGDAPDSGAFAVSSGAPALLPAQEFATPAASCAVTPPNDDVPPGENTDLDWLGSGAGDPSLWLMMTWDDGTIETNQVAGGYPVKLTFWRGEGSGDVTVTATGSNGETLPAETFEPFQGDPIPGLHPIGGTLPEPGCWTFTATDGNDTLTWTVDVREMTATPVAASAPNPVMIFPEE